MRYFPHVGHASNWASPAELDALRSKFKVETFREVFFGPTRRGPLNDLFAALWPSVAERIALEKAGPDDYKGLARRMQRAESRLMIDSVGVRLARELPHVPVASIHDSFLVPSNYAEKVKTIIVDEWARAGLHPSVSVKPC